MTRLLTGTLLVLCLSACAPEPEPGTFAHLGSDYVLSTQEPAFARMQPVRLRYEDDWLPRQCEGVTYLSEQDHVIIEWRCQYRITPETTTGDAFLTGGLSDDDGDGTYTGTLIGYPLTDTDTVATAPVAAQFAMTPCSQRGGDGPCTE